MCSHLTYFEEKGWEQIRPYILQRNISELNPVESAEKVVKLQLLEHFDSQITFSDFQFGFRKSRSTEQLLALAVISWLCARDKGLVTAIIFIDLSKAFDRVTHQQLLLQLHGAGISGSALRWFVSYLTERQQRVITRHDSSLYMGVTRGVPQGSTSLVLSSST